MDRYSPLRGLTRVPYYPELEVFRDRNDPEDISPLVLSCLLYWDSLDSHRIFNARQHSAQLARSLRVDVSRVTKALSRLTSLKLLNSKSETFKTQSENPERATKTDTFYSVNFHNLHEALCKKAIPVPIKVLRLASDDSFDFFTYISPYRLPLEQKLIGSVAGVEFENVARAVARLISTLCSDESLDDFCTRSLAPGWRMLAQPPCTAEDISSRYLKDGERAIDLDLTDGTLFLPDANVFGADKHIIIQSSKADEPKQLAAAILLCCAGSSSSLHLCSDLMPEDLARSVKLCMRLCGVRGVVGEAYFESLDLVGDKRSEAIKILEDAGALIEPE